MSSKTGESSSSSSRDGRDLIIVFCFLREGRGYLRSAEKCNTVHRGANERQGSRQLCIAFGCFSWGKKCIEIRFEMETEREETVNSRQDGVREMSSRSVLE